jgi:hypothetical protein
VAGAARRPQGSGQRFNGWIGKRVTELARTACQSVP